MMHDQRNIKLHNLQVRVTMHH